MSSDRPGKKVSSAATAERDHRSDRALNNSKDPGEKSKRNGRNAATSTHEASREAAPEFNVSAATHPEHDARDEGEHDADAPLSEILADEPSLIPLNDLSDTFDKPNSAIPISHLAPNGATTTKDSPKPKGDAASATPTFSGSTSTDFATNSIPPPAITNAPSASAPGHAQTALPNDSKSDEATDAPNPGYVRLPKDSPGAERRRRRRVKLGMRVLVRGGVGTLDSFDDVGVSVDLSRDGMLVITNRAGYWVHQPVEVVFPYSAHPDSAATAQKARILRSTQLPDGRWGLAIELKAPRHQSVGEYTSAPITRQVKVLVVETDPQMGHVVNELLLGDGYQVVIVPTAREALELLNSDVPDIILAEVECGNISGNDLCTIIKNDDRFSHIPVILMTNAAKPADYALGHQAGAVICMAKPYPPARLHHAVRLIAPPPSERSSYSARANISSFVRTS